MPEGLAIPYFGSRLTLYCKFDLHGVREAVSLWPHESQSAKECGLGFCAVLTGQHQPSPVPRPCVYPS